MSEPILDAPENVLSTLTRDGSRRWLYPRLSTGRLWSQRRWIGYLLITIFVCIPHIRYRGLPLILLDIPGRKFIFFGHAFLPTDSLLLALALVAIGLLIITLTTFTGRMWCGWACPQTVYMEYLFRPIDRLFEGTSGKGGKPKRPVTGWRRLLRFVVYLMLCMLLAHTFLAYFVGTDKLATWLRGSPISHPVGFLVMVFTTAAMMFDFLFFREQLCLIACPYGRFQSVMLDRHSLVVGYDTLRGEPRKKGKRSQTDSVGDCVDCNQCVVVCPTGIDIRDGLQMECINCTQCIDACNAVMDKVGRPQGLIRYSSQDTLEGKKSSRLRPRAIFYPLILCSVAVAFVTVLSTKYGFDARVLPAPGNPYMRTKDGYITNSLFLRLVNRSEKNETYTVQALVPEEVSLQVVDPEGLRLKPGETSRVPLLLKFRPTLTAGERDRTSVELEIRDTAQRAYQLRYRLRGP